MYFRLQISIIFNILLISVCYANLPAKVKCVDKDCKEFISSARVVKPIKTVLSDDLTKLDAGGNVKIFAKSADDNTNSYWGVEQNEMRGFVDSSFLKELTKDKVTDVLITDLPDTYHKFLLKDSEKNTVDPTETLPEVKSEPHSENEIEEDPTETTEEVDESHADINAMKVDANSKKVPDDAPPTPINTNSETSKKSPETPSTKDVPHIPDSSNNNDLSKDVTKDQLSKSFDLNSKLQKSEDVKVIEPVKAQIPSQMDPSKQQTDQEAHPEKSNEVKVPAKTDQEIRTETNINSKPPIQTEKNQADINVDGKLPSQNNIKIQPEKVVEIKSPSQSNQLNDKLAQPPENVETKPKTQTVPSSEPSKPVNTIIEDKKEQTKPPVINSLPNQPAKVNEAREASESNEKSETNHQSKPHVVPDSKKSDPVTQDQSSQIVNSRQSPDVPVDSKILSEKEQDNDVQHKETIPPIKEVPSSISSENEHVEKEKKHFESDSDKFSTLNKETEENGITKDTDTKASNKLESSLKDKVLTEDVDNKPINDDGSILESITLEDNSTNKQNSHIKEFSNDDKNIEIEIPSSASTPNVVDPWVLTSSSNTKFTECINYISHSSTPLKSLKYLNDVTFLFLNKIINLLPESTILVLQTEIPRFIGLSFEAFIMIMFIIFVVSFISLVSRCCLYRKDWRKEAVKYRDNLTMLEEKLDERDKANTEMAEWISRLAKQIKESETQVAFLKSDSSVQVKEIAKEMQILETRYNASLLEVADLKEQLQVSENEHALRHKALENRMSEETERLIALASDYEEKLLFSQTECERQIGMVSELTTRQEQLISQMNAYYDQMVVMKSETEKLEEEKIQQENVISQLNTELVGMQENLRQLSVFETLVQNQKKVKLTSESLDEDDDEDTDSEKRDDGEITNGLFNDHQNKQSEDEVLLKVKEFLDSSKLRAELTQCTEQIGHLEVRLRSEIASRKETEEKLILLETEKRSLETHRQTAEINSIEAQKKLDILTQYFKEREAEMQRSMGEQEVLKSMTSEEASAFKAKSEILDQEMKAMKDQVAGMRKELEDSERGYRRQVIELERRAHDNWLASRAAEREVKELKEETQTLRQRLLESEKSKLPIPPPGIPPNLLAGRFPRPPLLPPSASGNSPPLMPPGMLPPPPSLQHSFAPISASAASQSSYQVSRSGRPPSEASDRDRPPSRTSAATSNLSHRMPLLPPPPSGMPPLPMPPMGMMPMPPGMPPFGMPPPPPSFQNSLNNSHSRSPPHS